MIHLNMCDLHHWDELLLLPAEEVIEVVTLIMPHGGEGVVHLLDDRQVCGVAGLQRKIRKIKRGMF